MDTVVKTALNAMSSVKKPQKAFIALLLYTLIVAQGKANFRNMSRYSSMSEKRFRRWYPRTFDFFELNRLMLKDVYARATPLIAALDASFMSKSGKLTDGMGMFWRGCTGRTELGLELSLLCLVDLLSNTAFALKAFQTIDKKDKSRIDLYAEQVTGLAQQWVSMGVTCLAVDAYYFKEKFVSAVTAAGIQIVGKLRRDADLLWLYTGAYSGRGRPKTYDGKVCFENDLNRFTHAGALKTGEEVWAGTVYSKCLKCRIKLVMLRVQRKKKVGIALLYSTDTELDAMTLISYYKARFQIEFIFRDAKQYTGLMDCQSRRKEAIHTPINASFSALNLLKLEDRRVKGVNGESVISIASWKRRKFNQHLMCRVFDNLGFSINDEKVMDTYQRFSDYGAIAA